MRSREVYPWTSAFSSSPPRQNQYRYDSGLLAASRASAWRLRQQRAMKHLSQWTAHGAQHAPVAWPPLTFGCPLPARCWAPTYVLLFQATWAPSNRTNQCAVKRAAISVDRRGASTSQAWGPHPLSAAFCGPVRVLSMCTYRTRSCCCRWWRGRSPWRTNQAVMLPSSSQILATRPVVTISPSTSSLTCQVPPTSSYCARSQSEWSHSRLRSGLLTWHPSASTADSLLIFKVLNLLSFRLIQA